MRCDLCDLLAYEHVLPPGVDPPGFWTDWLEELDRQGLLEELLAGGVIARAPPASAQPNAVALSTSGCGRSPGCRGADADPDRHWLVPVRARTGSLGVAARHHDAPPVKLIIALLPGGGVVGVVLVQV
jgi:hypothetical protein